MKLKLKLDLKWLLGSGVVGLVTQLVACGAGDSSGLRGDETMLPEPTKESFTLSRPGQDLDGGCVILTFMELVSDADGTIATLRNGLSATSTCDLHVEPNERTYQVQLSDIDQCNATTYLGSNGADSLKFIDYRGNSCPNLRLAAPLAVSETIAGDTVEFYGHQDEPVTPPAAVGAFIGIGDAGRSGTFANVVTIIAPASQPRCFGCKAIKIYYDGKTLQAPIGSPFVSKVQVDMSGACSQAPAALPVDLASLYRSVDSPMEATYHVWYDGRGQVCDHDREISIQLMAERCLNPSDPQCSELEVRESFGVRLGDVLQLDLYTGSGLPNQAN